ncbi:MAG: alpha/beta hydrolase [SAR324 cluster bacterium]|nr:alpha/beta hydrolase [SAR324 cluster bacterium]
MKKSINFVIWILISLGGLAAILLFAMIMISPGTTPRIEDDTGREIQGSVAAIENVELGNLKQFVLMRGRNVKNPVLLMLHGGPGTPQGPHFVYHNKELEKHFIVVNWDQRGAGRSFSPGISKETMTIEQLISDTHELTQYLKRRFQQNKIYLLGHSWGSYLGIRTVDLYPEDYYAYIGIGQVTDHKKSETLSYQFVLKTAKESGNQEAIKELEGLEAPINGRYKDGPMAMLQQRRWVREFGGAAYNPEDFNNLIGKPLVFFREYSFLDKLGYFDGEEFSVKLLYDPMLDFNVMNEISELKIPIYILQGRRDYQTAFVLVKEYLEKLKAPHKELIPFEKSAHLVPYEEPDRFHDVLINKILKETYQP